MEAATEGEAMCNKYANTLDQILTREYFRIMREYDRLGNAEPLPAIWPKYEAPVVRMTPDGNRELVRMHWGFLTPQVSKKTGKPIKPAAWNNAREDKLRTTPLWRDSFQNRRCLIPASAFCETKGSSPAVDVWFGVGQEGDPAPFAFAGLWRDGQPGVAGEDGGWLTHTMVTTVANELVKPVHPTRMPVILDPADYETWLNGSANDAAELLRPFPAERMWIV